MKLKHVKLFESFPMDSTPAQLIYKLVEKNHYNGESNDIMISDDYEDVLKKSLNLFLREVKTYSYASWYFSEVGNDDLSNVNSWDDFFNYADVNKNFLDSYEEMGRLHIDVYSKGKFVKTLDEYQIIKEIYMKDKRSLVGKIKWDE